MPQQVTGVEEGQLGLELASIWNAGAAGTGVTCSVSMHDFSSKLQEVNQVLLLF